MILKNRVKLFVVGLGMIAAPGLAIVFRHFWLPSSVLALAGAYLLLWATIGKGYWCRNCKKFSVF